MDTTKMLDMITVSATQLMETRDLQTLCKAIVDEAINLSDATYGTLFLERDTRLEKAYSSSEDTKKLTTPIKRFAQKPANTKHITVLDATDLQQKPFSLTSTDITSIITIPLSHKSRLIGVLVLYTMERAPLSHSHIKLLELYAALVNFALTKTQLNDESIKALQMRDRFISLASHELRTPLTSINGYIQLLHNRLKNVDTVESRWINELYIESMRMTTLVKELLDVNRIKQGQLAFVFSEVSMQEVIENAIKRFSMMYPDYTIIQDNKTDGKGVSIIGDYDKLLEMISGLLSNAIKFSTPREPITVSLRTTSRTVKLTIKDQGRGISKQDLAGIFDGFYKGKQPSHKEGMGVGLLLAKHIVTYHRGKIRIKSRENIGTTVDVTMPCTKI